MQEAALLSGVCPRCQATFDGEARTCPYDGRPLVLLHERERRLIGRTFGGKYTVLGVVGRGGVGVVFRAVQPAFERPVAIKLLRAGLMEDPGAVRRFTHEVRAIGRLAHPNVITVLDFGTSEDGELYLVMELLEGRTLSEMLAAEGALAPARAIALAAGACDALQAAHDSGLVHRDLKPGNLFVIPGAGPFGEFVKVLDFGLARLKALPEAESLTRSGTVCGTPAYMSPEQALDATVDPRSDLYSLGVAVYEMLAGRLPFAADTPLRMLLAHVHEAPPPLSLVAPQVPPALAEAVNRALAKSPAERPPTVAAFKAELLAAVGLGAPAVAVASSDDLARSTLSASALPAATPAAPEPVVSRPPSDEFPPSLGSTRGGRPDASRAPPPASTEAQPPTLSSAEVALAGARARPRWTAWAVVASLATGAALGWALWTRGEPPTSVRTVEEVPATAEGAPTPTAASAANVETSAAPAPGSRPTLDVPIVASPDSASTVVTSDVPVTSSGLSAQFGAVPAVISIANAVPTTVSAPDPTGAVASGAAPASDLRVRALSKVLPAPESVAQMKPGAAPASADPVQPAPPRPVARPAPPSAPPLRVTTRPPGAEVIVDGASKGRTPTSIPRPSGGRALRVELRLPGHETRRLTVTPADPATIDLELRPLPRIVTE